MDPSVFPPSLHAPLPRSFPLPFSPVRLNKAAFPHRLKCLSFNQPHWSFVRVGAESGCIGPLSSSFRPRNSSFLFFCTFFIPFHVKHRGAQTRRGRPERSPAAPLSQDAATRTTTANLVATCESGTVCVVSYAAAAIPAPAAARGGDAGEGGIREKPPKGPPPPRPPKAHPQTTRQS